MAQAKIRHAGLRGNATLTFLGQWLRAPRRMGAVAPSSRSLARAMAREIPHDVLADKAPVIELGGGTGSITRGLLEAGVSPARLIVVERDPALAALLARRFPALRVLCGDAAALPALLAPHGIDHVAAIVSGLPLLLFPPESVTAVIEGCFALLGPGRPFIQFTYGFKPPLPAQRHGLQGKRRAWILGNLPPAFVWSFTRPLR